jgi:hypothetical protein
MAPPQDKVLDYLPDEGFFRVYYNMTKETEVCPRFNFFVGASIIGAVVNRKISFQRSSADIFPTLFPNLWVVLVAPQGAGHKTAALGVGRKLLTRLPSHLQPHIMAAKLTPEALVKTLATTSVGSISVRVPAGMNPNILKPSATGLLYSTEIGVLLGKEKYNTGMIALLTELYDCHDEWMSETIMRGDQRLYNVCLSLLGASTPDWLQSMLPADAFKGGFMSRLLLVSMPLGWERRRVADPPKPPAEYRESLVEDLIRIGELSGKMSWTTEAKAFFEDWYTNLNRSGFIGPVLAYLERKQDHLLRLAMIIQLTLSQDLILTKECLQRALCILDAIEKETSPMVEYVSTEPRMRGAQLLLEILRHHPGGLSESKLLALSWRQLSHPREFEDLIGMLLKAKSVKIISTQGGMGYAAVE